MNRFRFALIAAGVGTTLLARPLAAADPPVIHVAITPINYDAIPILYALRTGMFAKAGLDVQLQRIPSGAAVTAAVAGGAIDIGKSSASPLYTAFARGIPITVIAPGAIYDAKTPNDGLMVLKDGPIRAASDLNGQLIGLNSLNDISQASIEAWMGANGGDPASLRFVELPQTAVVAALEDRRIAAGLLTSPLYDDAVLGGKARVLAATLGAIGPRFVFSAYFATREWAGKHRDAVKKFADTLTASAAYTNAHHKEMVPLIAELLGVSTAVVEHMSYPTGGTSLLPAEVQPVIDIGVKYKLIPRRFTPQELLFQ
jgi:ABC-type nitrate/sulfonate/bicarbonate transport system substrate-binding protein